MENAAKALLIAAGVLIGLMLISLCTVSYKEISDYYKAKEEIKVIEQVADFNKQYNFYDREDVRGTDIITLVNKIIDFNNLKEEEKINISISIPNDDKAKLLYYNYNTNKNISLIPIKNSGITYTENTITSMLNTASYIESKYNKYTQGMAAKLCVNISTLMGENTRKSKKELLVELKIMNKNDTYGQADEYVDNEEILKYYQYQQFKRAHFDCKELKYTNQGRVKSFIFEFNGKYE